MTINPIQHFSRDGNLYSSNTVNTFNSPSSKVKKSKRIGVVFVTLIIFIASIAVGQPNVSKTAYQSKTADQSSIALLADDWDDLLEVGLGFIDQLAWANSINLAPKNFICLSLLSTEDVEISNIPFFLRVCNLRI